MFRFLYQNLKEKILPIFLLAFLVLVFQGCSKSQDPQMQKPTSAPGPIIEKSAGTSSNFKEDSYLNPYKQRKPYQNTYESQRANGYQNSYTNNYSNSYSKDGSSYGSQGSSSASSGSGTANVGRFK